MTWGRGVGCAVVLLLFGCSDKAPVFAPFAQSGSRIVYEGYRVGGVDLVMSTTDSQLGVRCAFALASDGVMRCLPRDLAWQQVYASASCDDAPVWASRRVECNAPEYGSLRGGYCDRVAVEKLTATTPPSGSIYELDGAGACVVSSIGAVISDYDFFTGEPVAADNFVAATEGYEHDADGVGVAVRFAEDGSRRVIGPHEARYGRTRAWELEGLGSMFIPESSAMLFPARFTDSNCELPAAWTFRCDSADPVWAVDPYSDSDDVHRLYEIGNETDTVYSRSTDGSCEPAEAPAGAPLRMFDLGEPATDPPLSLAGESVVGGAVTLAVTTTARGEVVAAGAFSIGETPCQPRSDGDRIYCTPSNAPWTPGKYFMDAQCSEAVHRLTEGQLPGDWLRGPATVEQQCGENDPADTWYIMGAEHLGDVWELDEGECKSIRNAPGAHYQIPEPISVDTFPRLELKHLR